MFKLGNHWIDEILLGLVSNRTSDEIIGVMDEIANASIEISADPIEITDHKGNIVRKVYRSKSGTLNSTCSFMNPTAMNLASGSDLVNASSAAPVVMPQLKTVVAGGTVDLTGMVEGSIRVIGMYGNGINADAPLSSTAIAACIEDDVFTAPAASTDAPTQYVVKFEKSFTSGIKLMNEGDKFPESVALLFKASYLTACDEAAPCYIEIRSFQPDPSTTISLDSENQEMEFNGDIQLDTCGTEKLLYTIFYPDEDLVETGTVG